MSTDTAQSIQDLAGRLLRDGEVGMVVGYARKDDELDARAAFLTDPQDADRLTFDRTCFANLVVYLPRAISLTKIDPGLLR